MPSLQEELQKLITKTNPTAKKKVIANKQKPKDKKIEKVHPTS